ncbi:BLUF domain-containing protein [Brevundimonas sp.]|uniref:BLUF domain-containing protein n=1 Tax=Brevundimonas sp. TaxID=1871086 RepID=UPI00286AAA21|nr:BLUF domain-containing protein [Brevundimonas sp.]
MHFSLSTLTGEQIRAGRALARIDQSDLARRCGLSLETIKRLERIRGRVDANSRTLRALFEAFSTMGVAFESCEGGGLGVCLAPGSFSLAAPGAIRPPGSLRKTDQTGADVGCHRLIYYSTANPESPRPLHELLEQVEVSGGRRKATLHVTGILVALNGQFLSVLEGPKDNVRQVYGAISCDLRPASLSIISDQSAQTRYFPDWGVCCGLFQSDAETVENEPALRDGFHPESLSPSSALGLLSIMRDLKDSSPRKYLHSRCPCPLAGACLDHTCASGASVACQSDHGAPAL